MEDKQTLKYQEKICVGPTHRAKRQENQLPEDDEKG